MWTLLLLLSTADAGQSLAGTSLEFGTQAGGVVRAPREPLGSGWMLSPRLTVWPRAAVGVELGLGIGRARFESGYGARCERGGCVAHQGPGPTVRPSLDLVFDPLALRTRFRPVASLGLGVDVETTHLELLGAADRRVAWEPQAGVGLEVMLAGALQLRADAKLLVDALSGDVRGLFGAGLSTRLSLVRDRDHDFVKDRLDACPGQSEDLDGFEDGDGCPDPDNDGDGVRDALDSCDAEPEDLDGVDDEDGCPE